MAHADIHADTHVFGSTRGYGTVASSRGVRADETRELEQFQFGEAATADRIARLESNAVMTGRPLRSGRFAISRMMPAGNDDAGRPTIEVITLLLEAREYEACAGALPMLAEDAGFWRGARASAAAGARVPAIAPVADANDPRVFRLFDLWRAAVRAGAVGVVPEAESDSVLRLVASLDPADRARCRWGIGLLSISAPADLCSIASGTSTHGARDVLRPAQSGAWHCGNESEYAAFRVTSGLARFPSAADIEVNGRELVVQDWAAGAAATAQPKRTEKRPKPLLPLAIGSAMMSTAVLAVALVMWDRRGGGEVHDLPLASGSDGKPAFEAGAGAKDPLSEVIQTPPPVSAEQQLTQPAAPAPPSEPVPAPKPEPLPTPPPSSTAAGTDMAPLLPESKQPSDPDSDKKSAPQEDRPPLESAGEAESGSESASTNKPMAPLSLTQAIELSRLIERLAPMPASGRSEPVDVYRERVDRAVAEWIQATFDASMLDRNLKEDAAKRDEHSEHIPAFSGFMSTFSRQKVVPLNDEAQRDWLRFIEVLHERLRALERLSNDKRQFDEYVGSRFKALEGQALDARRDGKRFLERQAAWKIARQLFTIDSLEREISAVRGDLNDSQPKSNAGSEFP